MIYGPHTSALRSFRVPWGVGACSQGSPGSDRNQQTLGLQWPGNGHEDEKQQRGWFSLIVKLGALGRCQSNRFFNWKMS